MKFNITLLFICLCSLPSKAQHEHHHSEESAIPIINKVQAQPLLAQAIRLSEALEFIGNALPEQAKDALHLLNTQSHDHTTVEKVQRILDPFCLAYIDINPESRVKVDRGPASAKLMQEGWTTFLIKTRNQANITAKMVVESPNAMPVLHQSRGDHRMREEHQLEPGEIDNRFIEMSIYDGRPMSAKLSGLELEYFILQMYTKGEGKREVKLGFNVGQGSQDIGFRNSIDILFEIEKAVKVFFEVFDENKKPAMASFTITDGINRFKDQEGVDYRVKKARSAHWMEGQEKSTFELPIENKLQGIYPLPARRLAAKDAYPDFFFQPQIYRTTDEYVYLPPGEYHVNYGRGPEYLDRYKKINVPSDSDSTTISFQLKRWIHMADLGWYSADHHIHASGCSHYESPEEGVRPKDMWRQVLGEDLNMGNNLTWGPSWYHQKKYFTGENHALTDPNNILRYDVEVSGFPSSHAGHIVLLNLKEDDYPGTTEIEEWPSWTLPVLQWAKQQDGITGYAHSGWGLEPIEPASEVPNYIMPKMDGIGANEYVVTITHDAIDFYSAGDTPWPAELNMWYHSLNCGYRVRLSGETDFPCISDEKVGRARIYAQLDNGLDFDSYMDALLKGKSYVSTGHAHLIDFQVQDRKLGEENSTLSLSGPDHLEISINTAAYLAPTQDEIGAIISNLGPYQSPYWHSERSRIENTRKVAVELIVNGESVDQKEIEADGAWNELKFSYEIQQSSWLAFRIHGSAHTNPIFVEIDGHPIRQRKSIEWCRAAVDQCWEQKKSRIHEAEQEAAAAAYEHARKVYQSMLDDE